MQKPLNDRLKRVALNWIEQILSEEGITPTQLAVRSGVNQTTITRPLNNPQHKHGIGLSTLVKISDAFGRSLPPELLAETEGRRFPQGQPADPIEVATVWAEEWTRTLPEPVSAREKGRLIREISAALARHQKGAE